jgi:hypothetical protein
MAKDQSGNTLANWANFVEQLRPLGERLLAKVPARLLKDPRTEQQAYRLLLMAMARTANDALVGNRDYPMFVPEINLVYNIYQPNADTVYKSALVSSGGVYRVSGNRGSILFAKLGQLGPDMIRTGVGSAPICYLDIDDLDIGKDGRFSVLLSGERPPDYSGNWWQLDTRAEKLMLRQVAYDWSAETDISIAIERLDRPAAKPRLSAEAMSDNLAELPAMILNAAQFFVDHVEMLREQGFINCLKVFDVSGMAGLENQFYYEGAYDLKEDEALIVSAKVPAQCRYWSLILTNDLYETSDWYNNHSSLNGSQAHVDDDGVFRAVVCARDPGVGNWLDTAGFASGAIQGRWLECSETPLPEINKHNFAEVVHLLPGNTPRVSPQARDAAIRERRAAMQQRRLW